jgi:hypothetical protein
MHVYVHLQLENVYTHLQHTWHAYSTKAGRDFRNVKTLKKLPSSSSSEGGCCSLENKHDKRMAPRAELLVSDRRLQKEMSCP